MLALVACNEILDNRAGTLRRDVGTTEAAPTQPAQDDGGSATPPTGSSPGAAAPDGVDAATSDTPPRTASACPPGTEATSKSCDTHCVSVNDPEYGCAAESCLPCDVPNATPACVNGACAIFACAPGSADCNANPADGCEADLMSPATCGSCVDACPAPLHATASCVGMCTFECEAGWDDCNGDPLDGCETDLASDAANCGQCGRGCLLGGCALGLCVLL